MPIIRPSRDSDISAIAAIYAQHVLEGTGTFEIDPPTPQDMAGRRAEELVAGSTNELEDSAVASDQSIELSESLIGDVIEQYVGTLSTKL